MRTKKRKCGECARYAKYTWEQAILDLRATERDMMGQQVDQPWWDLRQTIAYSENLGFPVTVRLGWDGKHTMVRGQTKDIRKQIKDLKAYDREHYP